MPETFELSCDCSAKIPVAIGQAGERVRCPSCGAERQAPRLGDLRRLGNRLVDVRPLNGTGAGRTGSAAPRWSAGHACAFAGSIVALLAGLAAALFGNVPTLSPVNESAIREMVRSTDLSTVLRVWQTFEQQGPQRGPPDQEKRLQAAKTVSRLLWLVTGAGALLAIGGGVAVLASGARPQRDR